MDQRRGFLSTRSVRPTAHVESSWASRGMASRRHPLVAAGWQENLRRSAADEDWSAGRKAHQPFHEPRVGVVVKRSRGGRLNERPYRTTGLALDRAPATPLSRDEGLSRRSPTGEGGKEMKTRGDVARGNGEAMRRRSHPPPSWPGLTRPSMPLRLRDLDDAFVYACRSRHGSPGQARG